MSTQGIDVTGDFPINEEVSSIDNNNIAKWTQLIDLLASTYPDIHSLMRGRNTNTDKKFSDIWTEMRALYLKATDSTENASWETFKDYLATNISYTPFLGTEDILTVMTGVSKLKISTNRAEDHSPSSQSRATLKRNADETIFTSYMHAPTPTERADADSLENILEGQASVYDGVTSRSHTSEISCTTSIHGPDNTTTFTYPEQQGKYYIQLKVFKFADVLTVPPEKLWTKALQVLRFVTKPSKHKDIVFQDMKFVLSDRAEDPITKHTMDLIAAVHRHSKDHPKSVQSTKRKRFTNW